MSISAPLVPDGLVSYPSLILRDVQCINPLGHPSGPTDTKAWSFSLRNRSTLRNCYYTASMMATRGRSKEACSLAASNPVAGCPAAQLPKSSISPHFIAGVPYRSTSSPRHNSVRQGRRRRNERGRGVSRSGRVYCSSYYRASHCPLQPRPSGFIPLITTLDRTDRLRGNNARIANKQDKGTI